MSLLPARNALPGEAVRKRSYAALGALAGLDVLVLLKCPLATILAAAGT
jgi:hypothetical protein